MRPVISLNWRRTSWTMLYAAFPTAIIVMAQKRNGSIAPIRTPTKTFGTETSMTERPTAWV